MDKRTATTTASTRIMGTSFVLKIEPKVGKPGATNSRIEDPDVERPGGRR
jgi:hypothetical protein